MSIPEPLKEFVESARSFIERAHNINATVAARNAESQLRSAKSYVELTPPISAAFDEAMSRIAEFHEEVADQNTLLPTLTPAIENARQMALLDIDRLSDALADARPSADARAIGADWY